jgi:hypothetical protein
VDSTVTAPTLPPPAPSPPAPLWSPRTLALVLAGAVAVLAALVVSSASSRSAWNDWRHTQDLAGSVREVVGR